ncbi:tRNA pseudouridine synthase [Komagataella phaffii CBS 7435]|uniref:Non-essential tRNA:pseudouridine synthase n=2 Tax=Komagataella phaffii TaxID=460519 RepID=C4QVR2_KOMPG|nr:Non-essential tRNA:pseudouridine synthase [Komagataella phaffii GS115]AOA61121.1 GQ67_02535T0 [Komagataella phaffii]CAH2445992.1 tRNA pseudouridine synthase [Komagataella phaffii CBS 7435]AOA66544.1 GQ68_02713T0 [Komagataella phaffii GS115]CAY67335.1 Non-essential tRNA:pseudouridine synthase [Komagataella phaffii GS115]SCV11778.1 tRNA pseudouridine synthase [Komagataella phaffii CBS 7435]
MRPFPSLLKNHHLRLLMSDTDYRKWSKPQLISRILQLEGKSGELALMESKPRKNEVDFSTATIRQIALKFSYLGWNYQGLAVQREATDLPTIEFKILEALRQCRMIPSLNPIDCAFSRCGRTDKGVSAMNQVIGLNVRSRLTPEELESPENDIKELDYINILNQLLPSDIRIHGVCLRPPKGFDARFSCRGRHYKYVFQDEGLDLESMKKAAPMFEGVHDFRNFCKVDGAKQMTNYTRAVRSSQILPLEGHPGYYVFDLKGTAFLWHQVRCMVAILLMIGQGFESPDIVSKLLDIQSHPQKPVYVMAHDIPLVLYDCIYDDDVNFQPATNANKILKSHQEFRGVYYDYHLKYIISNFMRNIVMPGPIQITAGKQLHNTGDGKGKFANKHVKLLNRPTVEEPEVLNEKWRKKRKLIAEQESKEELQETNGISNGDVPSI